LYILLIFGKFFNFSKGIKTRRYEKHILLVWPLLEIYSSLLAYGTIRLM